MRTVFLSAVIASLLASSASAAILSLVNDDGGSELLLGPFETGRMHIVLEIQSIDTNFAFANVFLDDGFDEEDDELDVIGLIQGFHEPLGDLVYDRSAYDLPADISHDGENQYGLVMGRQDGAGWGPGIYMLDTLIILNDSDAIGEHSITFEGGPRAPYIATAALLGMPWDTGMAGRIPDFADPGVGSEDMPFMITTIPEPTMIALVAIGAFTLLRRTTA